MLFRPRKKLNQPLEEATPAETWGRESLARAAGVVIKEAADTISSAESTVVTRCFNMINPPGSGNVRDRKQSVGSRESNQRAKVQTVTREPLSECRSSSLMQYLTATSLKKFLSIHQLILAEQVRAFL